MTKKLSLAELKAKANAVTSATALNGIKGGIVAGGPLAVPTGNGTPTGTLNPSGGGTSSGPLSAPTGNGTPQPTPPPTPPFTGFGGA